MKIESEYVGLSSREIENKKIERLMGGKKNFKEIKKKNRISNTKMTSIWTSFFLYVSAM